MVVAGASELYLCMGNVGGCISSGDDENVAVPSALIILLILCVSGSVFLKGSILDLRSS